MRNQYQIMTIFPKISQKRKESNIMEKDNVKYNAYVQILKEELLPAMGCTEPIAGSSSSFSI